LSITRLLSPGVLSGLLDVALAPDIIQERQRRLRHFLGSLARNYDDAVAVGHDDVTGPDKHTADRNRLTASAQGGMAMGIAWTRGDITLRYQPLGPPSGGGPS
jgi:hypothetical protein